MEMVLVVIGVIVAILFVMVKKGATMTTFSTDTKTIPKIITLNDVIEYNSKLYEVPSALIKAIIKQESNFEQYAKNPADPSYGYMQVMPIVFYEYGICKDWKNPTEEEIKSFYEPMNNIGAGCKLLHKLLGKYTMDVAVEMYNVGERGYNDLYRRNSMYRKNVMSNYAFYMENPNG